MGKNPIVIDIDNGCGGTLADDGLEKSPSEKDHFKVKYHPFGIIGFAKKIEIQEQIHEENIDIIPCRNTTIQGAIEGGVVLIHRSGQNSVLAKKIREKDDDIRKLKEENNSLKIENTRKRQKIDELSSGASREVEKARKLTQRHRESGEDLPFWR